MRTLKSLFLFFLIFFGNVYGFEQLDEKYCVCYGNRNAPIHIIQYYSFQCSHCLELFRTDFNEIQERYIANGEIFWVFHPAPMDLLTLHGMHCISSLSEREKQIFLGAILSEIDLDNFEYSYQIMVKTMELFGKLERAVKVPEDLKNTTTFNAAKDFILQEDKLESVPHIQVNEENYPDQVPDLKFIENLMRKKKN